MPGQASYCDEHNPTCQRVAKTETKVEDIESDVTAIFKKIDSMNTKLNLILGAVALASFLIPLVMKG